MSNFYQHTRWLELKNRCLDAPSYSHKIHQRLADRHFPRVLDGGTGAGHFIRTLDSLITYEELLGFDMDASLVEYAQEAFGSKANVRIIRHDLYDSSESLGTFDLITAQAMLEHTEMDRAIGQLKALCQPGTWLYFPHNYTSPTLFDPIIDRELDAQIVQNFDYFAIEQQSHGAGDSRCGQKLYNAFTRQGFEVLEFESTDWLLFPKEGQYQDEEKELLRMLVQFFYEANLHADISPQNRVSRATLDEWKGRRLEHIEDNELVFLCPQTSILVEA